jgi:hypothetical protein
VKDGERLNTVGELERHTQRAKMVPAHHVAVFETQRVKEPGRKRRRTRRGVMIPEELWLELLKEARHG